MKRFLFTAGVFALSCAFVGAQDTKPEEPKKAEDPAPAKKAVNPFAAQRKVEVLPAQPDRGAFGTVSARTAASRIATLEEDLELLEASRELRKAHVRVAEVGVKIAEVNTARMLKMFEKGVATREEADRVKLDVETAQAQVDIRMAEMKEVELRIKHAKKHLDDAKAAAIRVAPANPIVRPAVDPVPPPAATAPQVDPKEIEALKAQLDKQSVEAQKAAVEAKKAAESAKEAAAALAEIKRVAMLGRVKAGTIEAAEARAKEAQDAAEVAKEKAKAAEEAVAKTKAKLKELQK